MSERAEDGRVVERLRSGASRVPGWPRARGGGPTSTTRPTIAAPHTTAIGVNGYSRRRALHLSGALSLSIASGIHRQRATMLRTP